MKKTDFIRNCEELRSDESFNYPNDTESFVTGAHLGEIMGLTKTAVNYHILQAGDRSSWPHAHKEEEEFIFVLEGTPQVWIDGNIFDLKYGDCVSFPNGTGHAHTIINNSDHEAKLMVIGQIEASNDKIFYPLHVNRNKECESDGWFWHDHPEHALGAHDGWPDKKRPK